MLFGEEVVMRTFILVMVCLGIFSGCCSHGIDIKVKKSLREDLDKYRTAKINVQSDESKTNIGGSAYSESSFINVELFSILKDRGISTSYRETDTADLKVECLFRRSIGCPHVGRHLKIEFKHTSFVNLKFIDAKTNQVIGEVDCTRPSFKRLPGTYIKLMFDELTKKY
jgi:hypothetical protein